MDGLTLTALINRSLLPVSLIQVAAVVAALAAVLCSLVLVLVAPVSCVSVKAWNCLIWLERG